MTCKWDGRKREPPGADPRSKCEVALCTVSEVNRHGGSWSSRAGGTLGAGAAGCFRCTSSSVEAIPTAFRWGSNALATRPRSPS
jgi:hypothetical protein